jgi:glucosamine-6-phosphate deaminase
MKMDIYSSLTSAVERHFLEKSGFRDQSGRIPWIMVDNFPLLGLLTSLRFIEWVSANPFGVISLPTGKTPEYFIKWTRHILNTWEDKSTQDLLNESGLFIKNKPSLRSLIFVQMDDFYPIDPRQHNSFCNYVREFYLMGLEIDPDRALLINANEIPLVNGMKYPDVFPDLTIDLSLRHREARNHREEIQQHSIFMIDNWCMEREEKIRQTGGIGFFLGGIGPDGHIAFNIKGSDHHGTTRLGPTNYETQAAAATDLGGIDVSAKRHVITIGLGTIAFNPDVVALIFASGESKAPMVRDAVENLPDARYPATALQSLINARFYITRGAARLLNEVQSTWYKEGPWSSGKSIRALLEFCKANDKYAHKAEFGEIKRFRTFAEAPGLGPESVTETLDEVKSRLIKGLGKPENKIILHTGPHHDDIMLGLMPVINRQLRQAQNQVHFAVLTSGFTAISNKFIIETLKHTQALIERGGVQMLGYPDFFESGYLFKWDKDVSHYLNKVAERDEEGKKRGLCHRVIRCMVDIFTLRSVEELKEKIKEVVNTLENSYDGEKNPPEIQTLKGMVREFEEELVWAHSGIQVKDVHHLRLGFYQGDIFTEQPDTERDVMPVLELLRRIKPQILSVTMDPEGSGPDTHYKVLQTIARALRIWSMETDLSGLRITAYRNVWYRFQADEADVYVPVSLNSLAILQNSFRQCYLSQVDAAFPSPELKGPFCDLAQKVWVEQFKEIQLLLGKDFFYQNDKPLIRATHGLIFFRDLNLDEFLAEARILERTMDPGD